MTGEHGHAYDQLSRGDRFTDGLETLTFHTEEHVRIEEVTSIGLEGLRQVGVLLAGDDRTSAFNQIGVGFPPRGKAFGAQQIGLHTDIPPRPGPNYDTWELLIGYEFLGPVGKRAAIEIVYSVSGRRYRALIPARMVICERTDRDCSGRLSQYLGQDS